MYFINTKKMAQRRIIKHVVNSLKLDKKGWKFHADYSKSSNITGYTYSNESKNIIFKLPSSSILVKMVKPINIELTDGFRGGIIRFIKYVNNHSNFNRSKFVSEHIRTGGYYLSKIIVKKINLLSLRFWCYHNTNGKYYIDSEASDSTHFCWFEKKEDAVHCQLIWAGNK